MSSCEWIIFLKCVLKCSFTYGTKTCIFISLCWSISKPIQILEIFHFNVLFRPSWWVQGRILFYIVQAVLLMLQSDWRTSFSTGRLAKHIEIWVAWLCIIESTHCSLFIWQSSKKLSKMKIHIKCLLKVYARRLKVYMYYSISEAVPMFIFI